MGCGKGGNAEPCHIKATLKRKDNLRPPQVWTAVARRVNLPMTHAATDQERANSTLGLHRFQRKNGYESRNTTFLLDRTRTPKWFGECHTDTSKT